MPPLDPKAKVEPASDTPILRADTVPAKTGLSQATGPSLQEPDQVPGMADLPELSALPEDWSLISLHAMKSFLPARASLLALWEKVTNQRYERVLVRYKTPIVADMEPAVLGYVCDAAPRGVALQFAEWVGSQIFISRRPVYVECVPVRATLTVTPLGRTYSIVVVVPLTPRIAVMPVAGSWPIRYEARAAPPEVAIRAKAASTNPLQLLKPLEAPYAALALAAAARDKRV